MPTVPRRPLPAKPDVAGDESISAGAPGDESASENRSRDEPLRVGVLPVTSMVTRLAVLPALAVSPAVAVVAVASRSADRTEHSERGVPGSAAWHRDYAALVSDPAVEAVYCALPNALHLPWVTAALEAGKHVLCEKPLGLDEATVTQLSDLARERHLVLQEAYMAAFHPLASAVPEIAAEELGELRELRSVFGFPLDAANHRWEPALGGGALADVGIYCVEPLLRLAGAEPTDVTALDRRSAPGAVDGTFLGALRFESGILATIECSFETPERQELEIVGTEGTLRCDHPFTAGAGSSTVVLTDATGRVRERDVAGADPYQVMVEAFARAVRTGTETRYPLASTARVARVLDRLRRAADDLR